MNPLFPSYCRPAGYVLLLISLFAPFGLYFMGGITDANLQFYKECFKLLMVCGTLLIAFAHTKAETPQTLQIRNRAARNAIFITFIILFLKMLYRLKLYNVAEMDSSTFLIFLIVLVICQEYGMKKARIEKDFKK